MKAPAMRFLATLLLLAAVFYATRIGLHTWDRAQARSLLQSGQHRENPATLLQLATILNRGTLPADLGNQVLRVLVSPNLVLRDKYLAGRKVIVGVGNRRDITLPRLFGEVSGAAIAGKETLDRFGGRSFSGSQALSMLQFTRGLAADGSLVTLTNPGSYRAKIVLHYQLWAEPPRWPPGSTQGVPLYACEVELPVQLQLASASDIKPIPLVSDPELDEAMRKAFTSFDFVSQFRGRYAMVRWSGSSMAENNRLRRGLPVNRPQSNAVTQAANLKSGTDIIGMTEQRYSSLPLSIAMRAKYRAANGGEWLSDSFQLAEPAGQSGCLTIDDYRDLFEALPPGEHRGVFMLFTDSNVAYENPCISQIWLGTLSFPVHFTNVARTNQVRQRLSHLARRNAISSHTGSTNPTPPD